MCVMGARERKESLILIFWFGKPGSMPKMEKKNQEVIT